MRRWMAWALALALTAAAPVGAQPFGGASHGGGGSRGGGGGWHGGGSGGWHGSVSRGSSSGGWHGSVSPVRGAGMPSQPHWGSTAHPGIGSPMTTLHGIQSTYSTPWPLTGPHPTGSTPWPLTGPHPTGSTPWPLTGPHAAGSRPWPLTGPHPQISPSGVPAGSFNAAHTVVHPIGVSNTAPFFGRPLFGPVAGASLVTAPNVVLVPSTVATGLAAPYCCAHSGFYNPLFGACNGLYSGFLYGAGLPGYGLYNPLAVGFYNTFGYGLGYGYGLPYDPADLSGENYQNGYDTGYQNGYTNGYDQGATQPAPQPGPVQGDEAAPPASYQVVEGEVVSVGDRQISIKVPQGIKVFDITDSTRITQLIVDGDYVQITFDPTSGYQPEALQILKTGNQAAPTSPPP